MALLNPSSAFGGGAIQAKKKKSTPTAVPAISSAGVLGNIYSAKNEDSNKDVDGGLGGSNAGESGSSASTTGTTPSYSQSLFNYFKEQNDKARKSSLDAILAKLKMGEKQYNANLDDITDQYQALRNQSEVERYKSQRAMREALANRGQLDSGLGRQEQLEMDTQYGNAINSLNSQEAKAKGEVKNLIAQLRAEAELEKANIENQYNTAIQNFKTQMGS